MKFYIMDIKGDDEFTLGTADTADEAIEIARREWRGMCREDQKKNTIEVRAYDPDWDEDHNDYDTVEWRLWYAVQMDSEDDWGTGSFDKDEAIAMAERMCAHQVAVIDRDLCIEEIWMYDAFRVSAVFSDGTTIDNDMVYEAGDAAVASELQNAKEWFADKEPEYYIVSFYRDGECVLTEKR